MEKAVVFGTGIMLSEYFENITQNFQLVAIVDNDKNKQGTDYCGYKISSPEILYDIDFDCICITANYNNSVQIRQQLRNMGFESKVRLLAGNGLAPFTINPLFFATDLTSKDKEQLFSENVERIILELNSKCNRKCWFCTNSLFPGNDENIDMDEDLFNKILAELKKINYNQMICLSFFNEPLLSNKIIDRITKIKNELPESFVYIFCNGDYLNADMLYALEKAGLDMLIVDIYISEVKYDFNIAYSAANKLITKLNLPINLSKEKRRLMGSTSVGNMEIEIISNDFSLGASNRAESIPLDRPIPRITSHPKACIKNFISFHIDYRGDVWPCPNYHRDYEPHRQYCIGNLKEETIFNTYIGDKMTQYRERNLFHRNELPCRSCIWDFNSFIENRFNKPLRDRKYIENGSIYFK